MKIVLIADTHYGIRGDNQHFYDSKKKFFDKVFFPFLGKVMPDAIIHLGDLVDNRKSISYPTLKRMKQDFLHPLFDICCNTDIDFLMIAGNHDAPYKNSLQDNALDQLVTEAKTFTEPEEYDLKGMKMLMLPWVCKDNYEQSINAIQKSNVKYCFTHLSIKGFLEQKGKVATDGFDPVLFKSFVGVYSGHFHNRSQDGNICYVGAPFSYTWADYAEYRGFCVLDTETNTKKFYKNPYQLFHMAEYDEDQDFDVSEFQGKYGRIVVKNKKSESRFEDVLNEIQKLGVINLSILEKEQQLNLSEESGEIEIDDTKDIFRRSVDALENKESLIERFDSVYEKALNT